MPDSAASAWAAFEAALPDALRADLRPGASAADLDAAERALGLALPPDVREVYGRHDGQAGDAPGVIVGLRLLPLADAVGEWRKWQDVIETDPDLAEMPAQAVPEGAVRPVYVASGWLPLVDDGAGNHAAVDFEPGPEGESGQVITFGSDEPERVRAAPSLPAFLARLALTYTEIGLARDAGDLTLGDGRDLFRLVADWARGT